MSPHPRYLPDDIGPSEDGARLRIRWRDGAVTEQEPRALRLSCPCAGCVNEMTGERILVPETIDPHVYPREIRYVGRYGLQFLWSDGHSTGIYPFEFLRKLADDAPTGDT